MRVLVKVKRIIMKSFNIQIQNAEEPKDAKFVILEGIKRGNRFFTANTLFDNVEAVYRVLGYANTVEEAQIFLFGRSFAD